MANKQPKMSKRDVKVEKWNGLDSYQCRHCSHSTLDLAEAHEHWLTRHAPPVKVTRRRATPILDRFGNPITIEDEVEVEATHAGE